MVMLTIHAFENGKCETQRVQGSDGTQIWTHAGWLKSAGTYVPGNLLSTQPYYLGTFIHSATFPGLPSSQGVIQRGDASEGLIEMMQVYFTISHTSYLPKFRKMFYGYSFLWRICKYYVLCYELMIKSE